MHTVLLNAANVSAATVLFGYQERHLPSAVYAHARANRWPARSNPSSSRILSLAVMRADGSCRKLYADDFADHRMWMALRGRCAWLQGRREEAVVAWREAAAGPGLIQLADIDKAQGRTARALEEYTEAVAVLPESVEAWVGLGDLYERLRDWQEAERAYGEALRVAPESALAHQAMAMFRWRRGWLDQCTEQELERTAELAAAGGLVHGVRLPWIYIQLAQIYLQTGRAQLAETAARNAIELDSGVAYAHHFLGEALKARGDYRGAITELTRALELGSSNLWVRHSLALAYLESGDITSAREVTKRIRVLAPQFGALPALEAEIQKASARH